MLLRQVRNAHRLAFKHSRHFYSKRLQQLFREIHARRGTGENNYHLTDFIKKYRVEMESTGVESDFREIKSRGVDSFGVDSPSLQVRHIFHLAVSSLLNSVIFTYFEIYDFLYILYCNCIS